MNLRDSATYKSWLKARGKKKAWYAGKLVEENSSLVHKLVKKFLRFSVIPVDYEDAYQCGVIAFLYALDHDKSTSAFSTYLGFRVRHEINQLLHRSTFIRKPKKHGLPYTKIRELDAFQTKCGRRPTAEELGVTQQQMDEFDTPIVLTPESAAEKIARAEDSTKDVQEAVACLTGVRETIIRGLFYENADPEELRAKVDLSVEDFEFEKEEALADLKDWLVS